MHPEFLDIQDLSQYLGIKASTLYALVEARRIPHYRIGRLVRFKKAEIDRWMETCRTECIDPGIAEKKLMKSARNPCLDVEKVVKKVVAAAKKDRYNLPNGKPDQVKGLGKEVPDGTV